MTLHYLSVKGLTYRMCLLMQNCHAEWGISRCEKAYLWIGVDIVCQKDANTKKQQS